MRRIIGVDPGIALAGYGIIQGDAHRMQVVASGVLVTHKELSLPQRLLALYEGLSEIISEYNPTEIAVEELFFRRNVTTAFAVGQARGVFLLAAEQQGLSYFEYTPPQVKQGVSGYGKADKKQMQQMVKLLLGLSTIPKPDDVADALAVAICHMQFSGWHQAISK
ncbi:MAG: crossover junction endodeoxyribonuclease RuvC [Symbiobacteriaceae bacterium]|nr:crossover junction endodeoxyribonuclease RuvC [Symbiobacteriaceae bacterium]